MRIDCEQCGLAFTIEDDPINDRGARAHCPRCGTQKFVHKSSAPATATAMPAVQLDTGAFAAAGSPFAAPPSSSFGAPAALRTTNPFAPPASSSNPFAPPASSPNPRAPAWSLNPFAPSSSSSPFAAAPAGAVDPFGAPGAALDPVPDPFAARAELFGSLDSSFSSSPPASSLPAPSSSLPAPSSSLPAPPSSFASPPSADDSFVQVVDGPGAAVSGKWTVRRQDGSEETMALTELRERLKRGELGPDDFAAPGDGPPRPVKDTPMLTVSLPGQRPRVKGARAARTVGELVRPVLWLAAAAGAVGGGVVVVQRYLPTLNEAQIGDSPLRRARAAWQLQFPDLQGTSAEHLAEGRKQMRLDTAAGYRKADDELRQALLLDVGNTAALAAWVENFANLPQVRSDLALATLARDAVAHAQKTEPENVDLLRAQGALAFSQGAVGDAQRALTRALKLSPADIDSKLLLARSDVDRNAAEALEIIQRDVRARDPDNQLAFTIEGAARRRLGAYKEARELLSARLATDPQNVGALRELARLELDVGRPDAALAALSTLLQAEDNDVDSHLLRVRIHTQIKGGMEGLKAADAELTDLLARHEADAGELVVVALAHATFVKTQLGEVERALERGERACTLDANAPAALYALGRAYAVKGELEAAKKAVLASARRDQFYEPLLRAELSAVQGRSGDVANAIRNADRVLEYDPSNLRASFGLAALYIGEKKFTQAMTVMRKTLGIDPAWERDRLVPTDFPTLSADVLAFAEVFRAAKTPPGDESLLSLKLSSEGMIRFSAGQYDEAETLLQQALRADPENHGAILYLSIAELERGRSAEPRDRLKDYVSRTATTHAITQLYLARADAAAQDLEAARKRLVELVEAEPTLVQARYSLAMVLKELKLDAQADEELRAVVKQDPDFLPAKRALDDTPAAAANPP